MEPHQRICKGLRVIRRDEQSVGFILDEFRDPRYGCAHHGNGHGHRLDEHVWDAVAITVAGDAAGKGEHVAVAEELEQPIGMELYRDVEERATYDPPDPS